MTTPPDVAVEVTNDAMRATGVTVKFGGLVALSGVSLDVRPGEIVGLVGPNGAGKSTLFSVLSGLLRPNAGQVLMGGADVTSANPQQRARLGLARTFQQPELFLSRTVREHLVLGHRVHFARRRLWRDLIDFRSLRPPGAFEKERVDGLLELLDITRIADTPVSALPLGLSRLVEVGRALATDPSVLLLDEPLSGLDVHESKNLADVLRQVSIDQSVALLLVEHDVATVLELSSRIFVLDFGQVISSGTPEYIRNDPAVRAAYLGDDKSAASSTPAGDEVGTTS